MATSILHPSYFHPISRLKKIPTFLVEKQISHKIFVIAFEKCVFTWIRIENQSGSGFRSVLGENLDPDPYKTYTDPKHCKDVLRQELLPVYKILMSITIVNLCSLG